jgi:hypothetical protein
MEARKKGREREGLRSDLEFLITGLLEKDLKELRWVGYPWDAEKGWRGAPPHRDSEGPVPLWFSPGLVPKESKEDG